MFTSQHILAALVLIMFLVIGPIKPSWAQASGATRAAQESDLWSGAFGGSQGLPARASLIAVEGANGYVYVDGADLYAFKEGEPSLRRLEGLESGYLTSLTVHEGVLYVGGQFLKIAGQAGEYPLIWWDGSTWHAPGGGLTTHPNDGQGWKTAAIRFYDGDMYIAGYGFSLANQPAGNVLRWNGANWEDLGAGIGRVEDLVVDSSGIYVAAEMVRGVEGENCNVARWDGGSWIVLDASAPGDYVFDLALYRGKLVASGWTLYPEFVDGDRERCFVAEWDEERWVNLLGPDVQSVQCFIVELKSDEDGLYAVGSIDSLQGRPMDHVARWDGETWQSVAGGTNAIVDDLAIANGRLFVAGDFTRAGDEVIHFAAELREATWMPLSPERNMGTNHYVETLALFDGQLVVSGYFDEAGGMAIPMVGGWDGEQWADVNGEMLRVDGGFGVPTLLTMTEHAGELYAGGTFGGIVGVEPAQPYIARWDGQSWNRVGDAAFNGVVHALLSHNNLLYVGGSFTKIGALDAPGFAIWDGTSWSVPAEPLVKIKNRVYVWSMVAHGNDVYLAGRFGLQGSEDIEYVARWDGTRFHPLGDGIDVFISYPDWELSFVSSLAMLGDDLFVGGLFFEAGDQNAASIARWDGQNWHALGNGLDGARVLTLLALNGKLIVGGHTFTGNLVVWDGQTLEVLEGGTNDRVNALASDGVNLYVGGNFTMAGNVPSNYIASLPLAVLSTQTEATPELPSGASLHQAYPNPFGRSTTVPFTIDQPGPVSLRVFDVLGRSVAVLADGTYPAGAHNVTWDAAGLANGVYLVRFETPGTIQTRRLVLSR